MAKRAAVTSATTPAKKGVTYYPPPATDIQAYTRTVCQKLAGAIDAEFDTPEVNYELTGFMKVVASICSKRLNKASETVDTQPTQE